MATKTYTIKGTAPLLLNNGRGADKLDPDVKKKDTVQQKKGKDKTEADLAALERMDYAIKLYVGADGEPIIPSLNLEAAIKAGARKSKNGKQAEAGVFVQEDAKLEYDGPKDFEGLVNDPKHKFRCGFKQAQVRVYKVRPVFPQWSATFTVEYDPELVDEHQLDKFLAVAGKQVGLGDWRPKYGRFEVVA
jgi:hypothetical protein